MSIGESDNTFVVDILNEHGDSVLTDYNIQYGFGKLVVVEPEDKPTSSKASLTLDTS